MKPLRPIAGITVTAGCSAACLIRVLANSRIRHASEKPAFTVVLTIDRDGFTDPVVAVGLQQDLHDVFERWSDEASYVECFVRLMSKGTQGRKAARLDTGVRIDQGAVEVEKNRTSHGPTLAATLIRVEQGACQSNKNYSY